MIVREDRETGDEAADPTGSDELIGRAGRRRTIARSTWTGARPRWKPTASPTSAAVAAATRRSTSTGWKAAKAALAEHLLAQLHGIGGTVGRLAEAIVNELDETGYLDDAAAR